jgi:hypothetical protein
MNMFKGLEALLASDMCRNVPPNWWWTEITHLLPESQINLGSIWQAFVWLNLRNFVPRDTQNFTKTDLKAIAEKVMDKYGMKWIHSSTLDRGKPTFPNKWLDVEYKSWDRVFGPCRVDEGNWSIGSDGLRR